MKADTPIVGYGITIDFSQKERQNRAIDLLIKKVWIDPLSTQKDIPALPFYPGARVRYFMVLSLDGPIVTTAFL